MDGKVNSDTITYTLKKIIFYWFDYLIYLRSEVIGAAGMISLFSMTDLDDFPKLPCSAEDLVFSRLVRQLIFFLLD